MKVNYKSDFELTIQLTAGGVDVAAPSWDWQLRFFTCDRQAVYTVAYIDGKAERCAVNTDGTITAYFDKHGLMPGALRCEFVNLVPDSHYTHDTQMQVDPVELGVELWRGASDGGMDAVTLELAGQVLAEVQALAADLQQKAESGYFDGEPGPPGPAGPGLLVVAVTGSDQEALTADHTAGEILAAHEAGRPVVAVYGGEVYQLASVGASLASFSLASADLEVLAQIDVDGDGGAVRIFDEVQGALTAGDGIVIDGNVISATGGGGTGIESIEQTVTSDESGGINVVTITMSDGSTADFEVMNGKKGDKGDPGPKGDSGVHLGDVKLVNNLTTGGEESALTAEQGVVLKGMVDGCAHFGDDDKIILNQPLLDLIGVEGVDYAVIENMKFSAWNGNITTATGNYLILVTMKNGVISHDGLSISGYHGWWTADVKPSTSDPTVDVDGNAVTYKKAYYSNGTRNNVAVAKPYLLFDAGTDVSNFVMAFLSLIPTPIYDIKSVNDGIRIVSSSIDGVGNKTLGLLQKGIATKNNSLDTNCVIVGMKFDGDSPFKLLADVNSSIYLQPIPSGAQNVVVRGLQGTSNTTYHRVFILNESLTIIANDNLYGTAVVNQYVSLENVTGAKYLAFNASGTTVANDINDVVVLFDVPKDYNYWLAYNNYFEGEKAILDIPYETSGIKSCMTYDNLISRSSAIFNFLCEGITERYATFIFPDAAYSTSSDSLVQYDENDNVLKSESLYSAAKTNFGKSNTTLMQIRLVEGCVKLKFRFVSKLELQMLSLEELIARGNKVILSNRTVEWGNNQMSSVNGKPLNIKAKSPLDGKLICCMGDSITDFGSSSTDGSWAWYIQKNFDCGVANYGRGSAHFCDVANTDPTADTDPGARNTSSTPNNVVSTQVRWCIREMTEDNNIPDAIVLTGLTNDAFSAVNLGDLDTALAAYPMTADEVHTDFYGAAVYMVSKLRSAFPSAKIFFATPPRSLNPTQMQRLVQYVEAMRNVAKALGCGVIDFFDESLVEYPKAIYNASNESWTHNNPMYNTNDVLHPSQLGVNKMGQLASAKLSEYLQ